jgi:hypothetical protein
MRDFTRGIILIIKKRTVRMSIQERNEKNDPHINGQPFE